MSFRNGNKSKLLMSTKVSSPIDHWDMYSSVHSSCSLPESGQFPIVIVYEGLTSGSPIEVLQT